MTQIRLLKILVSCRWMHVRNFKQISRLLGQVAVRLILANSLMAYAQAAGQPEMEPLTLYELLGNASRFYPALNAARLEARASNEDTNAIKRQRFPTVSVTSETNSGNLRSYPTNAFQVQQTIWDFGRLSSRISEAEAAADISGLNAYLLQQDLFLQVISAWQNLLSGRERVRVAESTMTRLRAYQAQMNRRVQAEASPRIDQELVDSRLLQTEVELTTAKTAVQMSLTRLAQLTGMEQLHARVGVAVSMWSLEETAVFASRVKTTEWRRVVLNSPSVAKARAQLRQAENKLSGKEAEAWPQVYLRTNKPMNTIPTSQDTSMTTFVGLSYTPGAGLSTFAEAQALATRISGAQLSIDAASLDMQQTLQSDFEEFVNSRLRIQALIKAVDGSELVLSSYQRQFEAGKKTWLDLLNAVRELAQNQYSQVDAQATMLGAMYRLQLRIGDLAP